MWTLTESITLQLSPQSCVRILIHCHRDAWSLTVIFWRHVVMRNVWCMVAYSYLLSTLELVLIWWYQCEYVLVWKWHLLQHVNHVTAVMSLRSPLWQIWCNVMMWFVEWCDVGEGGMHVEGLADQTGALYVWQSTSAHDLQPKEERTLRDSILPPGLTRRSLNTSVSMSHTVHSVPVRNLLISLQWWCVSLLFC